MILERGKWYNVHFSLQDAWDVDNLFGPSKTSSIVASNTTKTVLNICCLRMPAVSVMEQNGNSALEQQYMNGICVHKNYAHTHIYICV